MAETPLVSICCITYNHENYIRDSIEGFLMQKADFPIEIIIHDDASTDKTADVIKEYAEKYPNLIIPIYQTENQFSKYRGNINPRFTFPIARGKYFAMCEGDDNWTDPLKLQKQVDFLEANPKYSICSHETFYTYINDPNSFKKCAAIFYHNYKLDGIQSVKKLINLFISDRQEFWKRRRKHSSIKRYKDSNFKIALNTALNNRYIPTMSIVARGKILSNIPKEMLKMGAGHRLLILWSSLHGKLHHMSDVMGFKNTQESSVTVTKVSDLGMSAEDKKRETIELLKNFKEFADEENRELLDKKIKEISFETV